MIAMIKLWIILCEKRGPLTPPPSSGSDCAASWSLGTASSVDKLKYAEKKRKEKRGNNAGYSWIYSAHQRRSGSMISRVAEKKDDRIGKSTAKRAGKGHASLRLHHLECRPRRAHRRSLKTTLTRRRRRHERRPIHRLHIEHLSPLSHVPTLKILLPLPTRHSLQVTRPSLDIVASPARYQPLPSTRTTPSTSYSSSHAFSALC